MAAAAPVATLTVDPGGTPTARTISYPVRRNWPDRNVTAFRQDLAQLGGGAVRTVARRGTTRPSGTLGLTLSAADRVWLRGVMADLLDNTTLRVTPDSTETGTYTDLAIAGEEPVERYQRVFAGRADTVWTIELPVVVLAEVGY